MNKKAQGLSMNTVIIAILVLVVLVFIIIFFTGGFSNISAKIKDTLFGVAAGQDKSIAVQNCRTYCDQAMEFGDNSELVKTSPYCTKWFRIDYNNDGSADKFENTGDLEKDGKYKHFFCSENHKTDPLESETNLGVSCPIQCT